MFTNVILSKFNKTKMLAKQKCWPNKNLPNLKKTKLTYWLPRLAAILYKINRQD